MNKNQQIILGLIGLVLIFIIFKGLRDSLKNMFATVGIGTSIEEDKTEAQIEKTEKKAEEFSPLYWQKKVKGKLASLIKQTTTDQYVKTIFDGIGYFKDSPEEILGVFRKLKYKTQVSWLADNWQKTHKSDLQAWLNDRLDTESQREIYLQILSITKNLPTGFITTIK
jgi:hypothetical protein